MDKIELIKDLFHGFDYNNFLIINNQEKYNLINGGANYILQDEETKKNFMSISYDVKNLYSVSTGKLSRLTKESVLFIIAVRSFIKKIDGDDIIDVKEINKHVADLLEKAIQDDELIMIGDLQKSDALSLLIEQIIAKMKLMKNKNIVAEVMQHAIKNFIKNIGGINYVLMQKFSDRFKMIAEQYNMRTSITDIEQMIKLKMKQKKKLSQVINIIYQEKRKLFLILQVKILT